jgi:hypothetical protein
MAINITQATAEIEAAIKTGMQAKYPLRSDGDPTVPEDFVDLAEGLSPGIVQTLQHLIDNTSIPGGEGINASATMIAGSEMEADGEVI